MANLYSTSQIAQMTGKAHVTIRKLVREHKLGSKVGAFWVLTEEELETLKKVIEETPRPGRPFKKRGQAE